VQRDEHLVSVVQECVYVCCFFRTEGQCAFGERESCYVVADGCVICGPLNFRLAFLGMFAMYYMLNVAYPACSSSTLEFIQRLVMPI
jgi:hypothetical protein